MRVKVKKLDGKAVIPYKKYDSDFCYDCVAVSEKRLAPGIWQYGLGLAFEIERGYDLIERGHSICDNMGNIYGCENNNAIDFSRSPVHLSIDARPRSSIWKTGMVLSNAVGTIDEHYRGEVSAIFYHVLPWRKRYRVGQKICQIKLGLTLPLEFIEVEQLSETDRGDGGFGSTGK